VAESELRDGMTMDWEIMQAVRPGMRVGCVVDVSHVSAREAREILDERAQIRAAYLEDRRRRGKARTGHVRVVR
jgi:hypothetical protein